MEFRFENDLKDSSGNNNNGAFGGNGGTFVTREEPNGLCLNLNGSGYVSIPDSPSANPIKDELCIDVWVQPAGIGGYRRILDKITSGGMDGFLLDLTPTNQVRFNVRGSQIITTGVIPSGNVWTHIVAVWKKDSNMSVYINGTQDVQDASGETPAWDSDNKLPFRIGADQDGRQIFNGKLDHLQVRRGGAL